MSDARGKELTDLGDGMFQKKSGVDQLCQEIADIFYPERADFTTSLQLDADFGSGNFDDYPVLLRRELGNSMSATLRPRDQPWFAATTLDDSIDNDPAAGRYLEYVTRTMKRGLYDARTKFVRATKEADHDFVTFGQCVLSIEESPNRDHLFFRNHHLRNCAWLENDLSEIDHLHRKDQMTPRQMIRRFGEKKVHPSIKRAAEKEPSRQFNIRCIVMPADEYETVEGGGKTPGKKKLPFTVVYIDADNQVVLKEGGLPFFIYCVPRWHTISGSQYAFSPATTTGLPSGRMLNALARILLEAGEKAVDPPMIATEEAVREVNLQAGAISWVDMTYDERAGAALRPVDMKGDMRTGFALKQDIREMLSKAFFIDKLALPESGKQMTAYEIRTRLEEHVRNLLPLFEPMEMEYNMGVLDRAFDHMRAMNLFDVEAMPQILSGSDFTWRFKNPMQEASTRILVEQFQEALMIEGSAEKMGVSVRRLDINRARDDALRGSGVPAVWRRTEESMEMEAEEMAKRQKLEAVAQELSTGAGVAGQIGQAAQSLQGAGMMQPPAQAQAQVLPGNVRPPASQKKLPMLRQAA